MAVAHVATGSSSYAHSTTRTVTSPAGAIGDLLIFLLCHDDHSDGPADDVPTGGIALTLFKDHDDVGEMGQFWSHGGDDLGAMIWWCIEDQTAGRVYTFGTLSNSEGFSGICIRYTGHHATTPLQAGSGTTGGYGLFKNIPTVVSPLSADTYGGMFVNFLVADGQNPFGYYSPSTVVAPVGWTQRLGQGGNSYMRMNINDRPVDRYPMPMVLDDNTLDDGTQNNAYGVGMSMGFVIAPAETSRTISGVTKDNDGAVVGSVVVSLFKDKGSGIYQYVDTVTSHSGTGAYSFTLINDSDAKFMAVGQKADSPHIFDCSDNVLTPS